MLTVLAKEQVSNFLQKLKRQLEVINKGPVKQKAAGCGIAGKKTFSTPLPEKKNENPILLKGVQVAQLGPK